MNSLDKMEDYDRLARLCEAKDAAIKLAIDSANVQEVAHFQQLSEAQAQITMLRTALEFAYQKKYHSTKIDVIENALAATSETVAAWRAKEIEPYKREAAMLVDVIRKVAPYIDGFVPEIQVALTNLQATALAYEREVKAKAIEDTLAKKNAGWCDGDIRASKGEMK